MRPNLRRRGQVRAAEAQREKAPRPRPLSTSIDPPIIRTRRLLIARPSPFPLGCDCSPDRTPRTDESGLAPRFPRRCRRPISTHRSRLGARTGAVALVTGPCQYWPWAFHTYSGKAPLHPHDAIHPVRGRHCLWTGAARHRLQLGARCDPDAKHSTDTHVRRFYHSTSPRAHPSQLPRPITLRETLHPPATTARSLRRS